MMNRWILFIFTLLSWNASADGGQSGGVEWLPIAISVIALIVSVIALQQNKKSLKPILEIRPSTAHKDGKLSVNISNKGTGPLTFTKFEMMEGNLLRVVRKFLKL
jgi:hypothetical protein